MLITAQASMDRPVSFTAFSRFGLGPRPGDLSILGDAHAAVAGDIAMPAMLLLEGTSLPGGAAALGQVRAFQLARQVAMSSFTGNAAIRLEQLVSGLQSGALPLPPGRAAPAAVPVAQISGKGPVVVPGIVSPSDLMQAELVARMAAVRAASIGFGERLVAFWANHFAVQTAADEVVLGLAGAFEREAIRPHVLGRFADMLLAATQHPAMLVSLNNATSIGPDSPAGRRSGRGLNENHARELMELHSVGVEAGYTQADVTSFAKILTGWTFGSDPAQPQKFGRFVFNAGAHEPGPQTVMGKVYAQPGAAQGRAVIADLAQHPATARHVCLQLARHFVADLPAASLVDRMTETFVRTRGDLKAVTMALLASPEAWSAPPQKLRTPQEFIWASLRALDIEPQPGLIMRALRDLGQPLWNPPSPEGFKDDVATWLAPDAMTVRADIAQQLAARDRSIADPRALAADLMGAALSADTLSALDRAASRSQALAILLMSPEFQRS